MKKFLSLLMVLALMASMSVVAFAANTAHTNGTDVTYNAGTSESYTVTVPAELVAGGEAGEVILTGTWTPDRQVVVDADDTVELSYSTEQSKSVNVNFAGITQVGSNLNSISVTKEISVDAPTNALFGNWTGHFEYTATIEDVTP